MILPPGGKNVSSRAEDLVRNAVVGTGKPYRTWQKQLEGRFINGPDHPRSVQVAGLDEDNFFVAFAVCFVDLQELQSVVERPCFRTLAF